MPLTVSRMCLLTSLAFVVILAGWANVRPVEAAVIVDGTAPGYVLNGSFESGSGEVPTLWRGSGSNLATDLGIDLGIIRRTVSGAHAGSATPSDGNWYTVLGVNAPNQGSDAFGVYLDTGHVLALGERFNLSFHHGEHAQLEGDETFRWSLFTTTTDDDSGVVDDVLASGILASHDSLTLTQVSLLGVGNVTASSAGERLFLAFTPVTASQDFIALDEVNLTSFLVPEPMTLLLLACAVPAIGLIYFSRR